MSAPGPTTNSPKLMGVKPVNCTSCGAADAPQYKLSCHNSGDLHCRNCLTKTWYNSTDELVRCPHLSCGAVCGFVSLAPLSQTLHLDNDFFDIERIEQINEQPEIMNNSIGFTRDEASVTLQHVYSMFEDQILDPVPLGGIPSHIPQNADSTFNASILSNPFYRNLLKKLAAPSKTMTTPSDLEEGLNVLLTRSLYTYTITHLQPDFAAWGIAPDNEVAVLDVALVKYSLVREIKENWTEIIQKWVGLLTWRHLQRLSAPAGGVA